MTILATVASMIIIMAGCVTLFRDLYNIAEALTSGMVVSDMEAAKDSENVHYKKALAVG